MPRSRIQPRHSRRGLTPAHLSQLSIGVDFFGAYGDETNLSPDQWKAACIAMSEDWTDASVRDQVYAVHHRSWPSWSKPWSWWSFESSEDRDEAIPEWFQLWRMKLIDAATAKVEAEKTAVSYFRNDWQGLPFRRPAGWWELLSPVPRDPELCELAQLTAMKCLTPREQLIVDGDEHAMRGHMSTAISRDHWLDHLSPDERDLIGLPPAAPRETVPTKPPTAIQ